jgi:hypothetical protein
VLFALFAFVNTSLRRVFSPKDGLTDSIVMPDGSTSEGIERDHAFAAMMLFGAAFMFNMNAAMWSLHVTKTSLNLQVAYISAVAAWTHYEMWLGKDWYVSYAGSKFMGGNAVAFSGLRQLEWCFTTPILLTIVQNIHMYAFAAAGTSDKGRGKPATYTPVNRIVLIAADECMLLCGWCCLWRLGWSVWCSSSRPSRASRSSSTTASTPSSTSWRSASCPAWTTFGSCPLRF